MLVTLSIKHISPQRLALGIKDQRHFPKLTTFKLSQLIVGYKKIDADRMFRNIEVQLKSQNNSKLVWIWITGN